MNALHQPSSSYERKSEAVKTAQAGKGSNLWRPRDAVKPVQTRTTERDTSAESSANGSVMCWNCKVMGHFSKDCPTRRKSATCYGCGVAGHIRPNCPERGQSSVAMVARETRSHPYRRFGRINGRKVDVLLDTGSHYNLVKASVAINCGLAVKPANKPLYGLGSTSVPSVRAVGMAYADISMDGVCPGPVSVLVVPDTVQQPDVLIGRVWLDLPAVEYRKVDGQLHLYRAESCSGQTEPTVTTVGCDADYINTVEVCTAPTRSPLVEADFGYVKPDATAVEREELIELVNEYRECFAKNLGELGCTPWMTVDINEVPGSGPVVCRPYKTTPTDREEIAKIVADWKQNGVVRDTISPYASPVLLVKQAGGKNRLCVDFRRLNKQTVRQHYPLPDMLEQLESLAEGRMFV
uniref:Transposon Ty3-I Gag-Pol polyprotein n=1 Tax=Schizaphis graminum TaxID=13262 RepID=A0A2S2PJ96_SCHGA